MEIKESELREHYKKEVGLNYYDIPMKYMFWRKEKIGKLLQKNNCLRIIRDDAESYPDHKNSIRINSYRAIWTDK